MFSIICLGRNGLYPTPHSPTSGYLLSFGDKKVLLDIGSGVFAALLERFSPEDLSAVVVSHFHGDHVADLTVFDYYLATKGKKVKLFAPLVGNEAVISKLKNFEFAAVEGGSSLTLENAVFKFFKTNHPVNCVGVRVEFEGKAFVYSGDTNVCDDLAKAMEGASLAVLDSAFSKKNYSVKAPHLSSYLCAEYAENSGARTLLSHLPPAGDLVELEKEAKDKSNLCSLIETGKEYII